MYDGGRVYSPVRGSQVQLFCVPDHKSLTMEKPMASWDFNSSHGTPRSIRDDLLNMQGDRTRPQRSRRGQLPIGPGGSSVCHIFSALRLRLVQITSTIPRWSQDAYIMSVQPFNIYSFEVMMRLDSPSPSYSMVRQRVVASELSEISDSLIKTKTCPQP